MPSPHVRTVQSLTAFIVNAPEAADRFTLSTRPAMGNADELLDLPVATMLQERTPDDFAAHCVVTAKQWADGGAMAEAQFVVRFVDESGHTLTVQRFRVDSVGAESLAFDGTGESVLRQLQEQNQTLLEFNLKGQRLIIETYGHLIGSMTERMRWLERKLGAAEDKADELEADAATHSEEDREDERFEKLLGAVVEVGRQLNNAGTGEADAADDAGGE